jgi:hypothetical protein
MRAAPAAAPLPGGPPAAGSEVEGRNCDPLRRRADRRAAGPQLLLAIRPGARRPRRRRPGAPTSSTLSVSPDGELP